MVGAKSLDYVSTALAFAVIEGILGILLGIALLFLSAAILSLLRYVPGVSSISSAAAGGIGIVIVIATIVLSVVVGFIGGLIFAFLYNFVFVRWVKLSGDVLSAAGNMAHFKSLDYISAGVVFAVIDAVINAALSFVSGIASGSIIGAVVGLIGGLILGAIGGFIGGFIVALLYNLIVARFIQIGLQT